MRGSARGRQGRPHRRHRRAGATPVAPTPEPAADRIRHWREFVIAPSEADIRETDGRWIEREPGIWMRDVERPRVGHNDVLIRIRKTAICGTDMHIYLWDQWAQKTIPVPMAVGHEYVGEIVEIGSEVQGFAIGDRVSGEGHVTCGLCRNCPTCTYPACSFGK